ncbi:uncharacterized protein LOC122246765 isoform X3 [Penaeus japonicus]|uniref:uncharacterized protein LOC122246765 isoform X3 n=1 Tax=Penaeus japonicus TaxID=27405 RepID=UPI001C715BC1|nr:uncharacterized protein LOC122246765 isoform X3 [Penaeus japonicus]
MDHGGKWLWETTGFFDCFSLCYQLTLATREPLQEECLARTLGHLFRKVPALRTCYGRRDGATWLREMAKEVVDFEVVQDASIMDMHDKLQHYHYATWTGPLWCARLWPRPRSSLPDEGVGVDQSRYPHTHTLFLGFHHGITDGNTNMRICGFLVQLLNDVLAGRPINDEEQLGIFVSDGRTKKLLEERIAYMELEPDRKQRALDDYNSRHANHSLIKSTFKGVGDKVGKSLLLTSDVDAATTTQFVKRCRAEKVTVNSAFTALANVALVDLLVDGGLEQDAYSIRGDHIIDARRYWDGDTSQHLGCHILPQLAVMIPTPRDTEGKFWDYARLVHADLKGKLEAGTAVQDEAVKYFMSERPSFETIFACEFNVSNIGDVTSLVTEGGEQVQAVHVLRSANVDGIHCPWTHLCHTFRSRFIHVLSYNTASVSSQMAEEYCNRIFHHLRRAVSVYVKHSSEM